MRYRIDFFGDRYKSMILNSREELIGWLKSIHPNTIEDVRKIYSNGISDSVMDHDYVKRIMSRII